MSPKAAGLALAALAVLLAVFGAWMGMTGTSPGPVVLTAVAAFYAGRASYRRLTAR